jgi:S-(hydroxymethyl)glutathione dehydrogenase/alcohol dehydrogenase
MPTTQAAVLVELGRPLEIAELDIPAPGPGQVLVEIAFAGVCHTQLLEARGRRGPDAFLPHCLGHEGTGTVISIGDGVVRAKPGDAVVLSWIKAAGANVPGVVYRWNGRDVNAGAVTTFQRHAIVSENRITLLTPGLSLRDAVMLGCALPTGMGAVVNTAAARPGESAAIFGAGGVGLCAVAGAACAGCAPILVVDPNPLKRTLALAMGATHAIDPAAGEPTAQIRAIVGGGVDFAVEATGLPDVMAQALAAVRPQGGRAVVIGNAASGAMLTIDPQALNQGKQLRGCWGGDVVVDRDFARFGRLLAAGRIDVAPLLSQPYALSAVNAALDDLETGRVGRPLIDMTPV